MIRVTGGDSKVAMEESLMTILLQSCGDNKGKPTWDDKAFWGWQQQTVVAVTVPMLEREGKASGDGNWELQKRATPHSCDLS